jgi:rhodanese-related sulfurtransferase
MPMNEERKLRHATIEAAMLMVCSIILAVCYNHLSGKGIAWVAAERIVPHAADSLLAEDFALPPIGIADGQNSIASNGPLQISLSQAYKLYSNRQAIFLDAREKERYSAGHIAGATHFSYYQREKWEEWLAAIKPQTAIVAYCDDGCDSALRLADELSYLGYTKVLVLDVGYDTWREAGYPTRSENP